MGDWYRYCIQRTMYCDVVLSVFIVKVQCVSFWIVLSFVFLYVISLVQLDDNDSMSDTAQGWDEDGLHFCS